MDTIPTDRSGSSSRIGYFRLRDAIRSDIITGVFDAGLRLKIPDLCRRYGVSSIPVREALQQLHGEGLIIMVPNRGATVRSGGPVFVTEIYEVCEAIDAAMARRFVELAAPDGLADLERAQHEWRRAMCSRPRPRASALALEHPFHRKRMDLDDTGT